MMAPEATRRSDNLQAQQEKTMANRQMESADDSSGESGRTKHGF